MTVAELSPEPKKPGWKRWLPWLGWLCVSAALAGYLSRELFAGGAGRTVFLPGETTGGHYQFEVRCEACHTSAFATRTQMQEACEECHAAELKAADDSHPKKKFTDPRNADRVAKLDARYCVTCHMEHRPGATGAMGVTLPQDYCYSCHAEIGDERASHKGLPFDGCAAAGCHNFHDNRALYEDFLERGLDEPPNKDVQKVLSLLAKASDAPSLGLAAGDAPAEHALNDDELAAWSRSEHGRSNVNCSGCHGEGAEFSVQVNEQICERCHEAQTSGWLTGKHGLRKSQGLTAMTADSARQPMSPHAKGEVLGCNSCHASHEYNTRQAAVDACLGCHDDEHSRNYEHSAHARLWREELLGQGGAGTGVSCATCHMPRFKTEEGKVVVQHNQSDNLRPSEKMIRGVCSQCHGLGFAIDALVDAELVRANFSGAPAVHNQSLDMVRARLH